MLFRSTGEERIYAETKIRDVNEAYKILSDSFLREQYDNEITREKEETIERISKNNNQYMGNKVNEKATVREGKTETKIGTFGSMVNVVKSVFKPRKLKNVKYEREDFMALGITITIVIVLGLILWFVPATNQLLRKAFPLFN